MLLPDVGPRAGQYCANWTVTKERGSIRMSLLRERFGGFVVFVARSRIIESRFSHHFDRRSRRSCGTGADSCYPAQRARTFHQYCGRRWRTFDAFTRPVLFLTACCVGKSLHRLRSADIELVVEIRTGSRSSWDPLGKKLRPRMLS
jgi:hypothetical protein